jgi:transposase
MGQWMIGASQRHLQRLYDAIHARLLAQPLIHGDETTVQVPDEDGRSAQSQSYIWVCRSAESSAMPVVLCEYQAGRGQQHPQAFLRGFAGTLMTDGYSAWRTRCESPPLLLPVCQQSPLPFRFEALAEIIDQAKQLR